MKHIVLAILSIFIFTIPAQAVILSDQEYEIILSSLDKRMKNITRWINEWQEEKDLLTGIIERMRMSAITIGEDVEIVLVHQQDENGMVSIPAVSYDKITTTDTHGWENVDGGLQVLPNDGVKVNDASGPGIEYKVNFVKGGTHHIWVSGEWMGSGSDSLHCGLDGVISCRISLKENELWAKGSFDATLGDHILNIWMREDGTKFSAIILTTDLNFVPTN